VLRVVGESTVWPSTETDHAAAVRPACRRRRAREHLRDGRAGARRTGLTAEPAAAQVALAGAGVELDAEERGGADGAPWSEAWWFWICVTIAMAVFTGTAKPWLAVELNELPARRGGVDGDHLSGAVDQRSAGSLRAGSRRRSRAGRLNCSGAARTFIRPR